MPEIILPKITMRTQDYIINAGENDGCVNHTLQTFHNDWESLILNWNMWDEDGFYDLFIGFTNISIPKGSTIIRATLSLSLFYIESFVETELKASMGNAIPTDYSEFVALVGTENYTDISLDSTDAEQLNQYDVTDIIREKLSLGNWIDGNNIVFFTENTYGDSASGADFDSYEFNPIAQLTIVFEPPEVVTLENILNGSRIESFRYELLRLADGKINSVGDITRYIEKDSANVLIDFDNNVPGSLRLKMKDLEEPVEVETRKKISDMESGSLWESGDWAATGGTYAATTIDVLEDEPVMVLKGEQAARCTGSGLNHGIKEVFASPKNLTAYDYISWDIYIPFEQLANMATNTRIRLSIHKDDDETEENYFYYDVAKSDLLESELTAARWNNFKILKTSFTQVFTSEFYDDNKVNWKDITGVSFKFAIAAPTSEMTFVVDCLDQLNIDITGITVNPLTDFIKPIYMVTKNDIEYNFPLGVYLITRPGKESNGMVTTRNIVGYDLLLALEQTKLNSMYFDKGDDVYGTIDYILGSFIPWASYSIYPSTEVLAEDMSYEGKSLLFIINSLLNTINYYPLWVTGDGVIKSQPWNDNIYVSWTFEDNENSLYESGITQSLDYSQIFNKVVVKANQLTADTEPLVKEWTFEDEGLGDVVPFSITNIGREITKFFDSEAVSQDYVDLRARRELLAMLEIEECIRYNHAFVTSRFNDGLPYNGDYYRFINTLLNVDAYYKVKEQSFDLKVGSSVKSVIRKVNKF